MMNPGLGWKLILSIHWKKNNELCQIFVEIWIFKRLHGLRAILPSKHWSCKIYGKKLKNLSCFTAWKSIWSRVSWAFNKKIRRSNISLQDFELVLLNLQNLGQLKTIELNFFLKNPERLTDIHVNQLGLALAMQKTLQRLSLNLEQ